MPKPLWSSCLVANCVLEMSLDTWISHPVRCGKWPGWNLIPCFPEKQNLIIKYKIMQLGAHWWWANGPPTKTNKDQHVVQLGQTPSYYGLSFQVFVEVPKSPKENFAPTAGFFRQAPNEHELPWFTECFWLIPFRNFLWPTIALEGGFTYLKICHAWWV